MDLILRGRLLYDLVKLPKVEDRGGRPVLVYFKYYLCKRGYLGR